MARIPARFLTFFSGSLLFLLFLPSLPAAQTLQRRTHTLGDPFNDSYRSNLTTLKDASVNGNALQLTPDTRNNVSFLLNKSGRVLFPTPIRIWEDRPAAAAGNSSNTTAGSALQRLVISFNTSFHFNVFREANQTAGEGLAFIIVADGSGMPAGSEGGYLGLTNATIDGSAANQLVAVEFDTVKQPYDPDDNHVGIDVNSVVSVANRSLSELNITISPETAAVYTAWVDYSGSTKRIDVYVDNRGRPKPRAPALSAPLDLGANLAQVSYFGFAGSTGVSVYELNCILGWNLTVEVLPERSGGQGSFVKIGVPVLAAVAAVAVAGAAWFCYLRRRRRGKGKGDEKRLAGTLKSLPGTPREFGYKELKRATAGFDEKNRLGQGGFGVVYRGVIPGEGTQVAVKLFSRDTMQGDFLAELTIINRLRHKNLVRLLGWCHKNGKLLLVYDYMPNGSLDFHLYNPSPAGVRPLPWDRRYKVLAGVASALHYLHNEYEQKVVHRDLKASNILLDADFNARLGDFGLARAIDHGRTSYAEVELDGVPGTVGYVAPECFHTGKATRESDVFGFGAVILEVVCGRRPRSDVSGFRFVADWVWKLHREGCLLDAVDPQLGGEYSAEEAQRLLLLGLACSHPIPGDRPKTQAVVQIISGSVPPPKVPPFRPAFVWPSMVGDDDDGATSTIASSSAYVSTPGWTPHYTSKDSPDASFV
ncbi:hypothetical protein Taro_032299 [Colocasia esculenta]|uniref:non-specific serine/threonine protein kinase n=1 Tax=Colocasia esculenta TaxID=4460 RepID=A0A843VUH7_COLES|nr:hypothetical protein [Colocasia esculenta]